MRGILFTFSTPPCCHPPEEPSGGKCPEPQSWQGPCRGPAMLVLAEDRHGQGPREGRHEKECLALLWARAKVL